jgi:hypothetical protein
LFCYLVCVCVCKKEEERRRRRVFGEEEERNICVGGLTCIHTRTHSLKHTHFFAWGEWFFWKNLKSGDDGLYINELKLLIKTLCLFKD